MLGEYLKEATSRPWKPGEHDCCALVGRWLGIPMPAYSTDEEARALIDRAGGLLGLVSTVLDSYYPRTDAPQEGDVGVIVAVGMDRVPTHVGAIYTGRRWAFASPRGGIVCASANAVAVWRT